MSGHIMANADEPILLTLNEVAHRIGFTTSGVRGLIARGELIAVKHGRQRGVRVRATDLDRYLASLKRYEGPPSLRNRRGESVTDDRDRESDPR